MARLKDTIINGDLQVSNEVAINGTLSLTAAALYLDEDDSLGGKGTDLIIDSDRVTTSRLKLTCAESGDAETSNPALVIGDSDGTQLFIDTNEIHAKNRGEVSTLYLNCDGNNGNVEIGGKCTASQFNASSDKRLKENIAPYISKKTILDLPIYKYDFINGKKNQIGCIAQDLQEICPEIVDENSNGYLSIQESKIVYLLLEEVKKLRKEVNELKGKI